MNSRHLIIISFLSFSAFNISFAQQDSLISLTKEIKTYGLYFQYNGITKPYVEFGIGKSKDRLLGHHPLTSGLYLSSELKIDVNKVIIGPKIGAWASGGVAPISIGGSFIYYDNISSPEVGTLRLRPEVGIGLFNLRAFLGINIPILNYNSSREYVSLFTLGGMIYLSVLEKGKTKKLHNTK